MIVNHVEKYFWGFGHDRKKYRLKKTVFLIKNGQNIFKKLWLPNMEIFFEMVFNFFVGEG
jgi:hypothetical protein